MSNYLEIWNLRKDALETFLGKSSPSIRTSPRPIFLGGFADVMRFDNYLTGITYVTGGLIGLGAQKPNSLGQYELMICTTEPSDWAADLISRLAPFTHQHVVNWGDTMGIGPVPSSTLEGLLFVEPLPPAKAFSVQGQPSHLMLCIGITGSELAFAAENGNDAVIDKLKAAGFFPYTHQNRKPVV